MATTTMTPLEAIAYLHSTLPARPELYEDDEHTAALLALGPLVGAQPESLAQVRSDEAQPLMTGTWSKEQGASTVAMEDAWSGAIGPVEATPEAQPAEMDDACTACGEGDPLNECSKSERPCGHHCNHVWSHGECHWCGFEVGEEPDQPAEPLFTAEFEEADGDKVTLWLSGQSFELAEGQQVDVYPHGSRPAPRKVTAELTATPEAVAAAVCEGFGGGRVCDTFDPDVAAAAVLAILASKAGA